LFRRWSYNPGTPRRSDRCAVPTIDETVVPSSDATRFRESPELSFATIRDRRAVVGSRERRLHERVRVVAPG